MQNDLISRSTLLKEIKSLTVTVTGLRAGKGILSEYANQYKESLLRIVNEQPTAYDVDAVVERLDKKRKEAIGGMEIILHHEGHSLDYEFINGQGAGYKEAIDIVRNGGKE